MAEINKMKLVYHYRDFETTNNKYKQQYQNAFFLDHTLKYIEILKL